jgi:hypothetical protein
MVALGFRHKVCRDAAKDRQRAQGEKASKTGHFVSVWKQSEILMDRIWSYDYNIPVFSDYLAHPCGGSAGFAALQ